MPRTSTMIDVSAANGALWMQSVVLGPAQNEDDWFFFLERPLAVEHMGMYQPSLSWELQPANCVLLFDSAGNHDQLGDEFLSNNFAYFLRLSPYSPYL